MDLERDSRETSLVWESIEINGRVIHRKQRQRNDGIKGRLADVRELGVVGGQHAVSRTRVSG